MEKNTLIGGVVVVIIVGACFYWFQLRPNEIRKECSWVPELIAAIPALTQDQINQEQLAYNECVKQYPTVCGTGQGFLGSLCRVAPQCAGMPTGYDVSPHPATATTTQYNPAAPATYNFCLHAHGL